MVGHKYIIFYFNIIIFKIQRDRFPVQENFLVNLLITDIDIIEYQYMNIFIIYSDLLTTTSNGHNYPHGRTPFFVFVMCCIPNFGGFFLVILEESEVYPSFIQHPATGTLLFMCQIRL